MIELGEKVKDDITGFEGIAVARCYYISGCIRIGVQGQVKQDGSVPDPEWFDEDRLESKQTEKKKGGPMPTPKLNADPL